MLKHRLPHRRHAAIGLLGSLALSLGAVVGPLGSTPTAVAAPADQCPAAYPHEDLVAGQTVHGLTTTDSTTPEAFTGTFVNTLYDALAPGRDMLIFKLAGSRITKSNGDVDAGIWAGISGSPIYDDATGELVGSVSYGFSAESSDFAGVTPAAYIYELRQPRYNTAATTAKVKLSAKATTTLKAAGLSTRAAAGGLKALEIPRSVSGINAEMATKIAKRSGLDNTRFVNAAGAASTDPADYPVVAGGSIAGTDASGEINYGGIGTVTAVCGSTVIAYGHPSAFAGNSLEALHGASAVFIQRDNSYGSYKMANIGPVVGAFTQDRIQGFAGKLGTYHPSTAITTKTTAANVTRTGISKVTQPAAIPFIAGSQVATDTVYDLNEYNKGESDLAWTISIKRANGKITKFTRSDRYTSPSAIADEAPSGVSGDLMTILDQDLEKVSVTDVSVTNKVSSSYRKYKIAKVRLRHLGKWRRVEDGQTVKVKAGHKFRVRIYLKPANSKSTAAPTSRDLVYKVPKKSYGKKGTYDLQAGGIDFSEFEDIDFSELFGLIDGEEPPPPPESFDEILDSLSGALRQDEIAADFNLFTRFSSRVVRLPAVTTGSFSLKFIVNKN
ncbi:SpoIVB peptidase S55 domain-containing protein [soil metagenome]